MLKWWNLSLLFRQRKFNHVLYLPILYYSMKKTKNIFHNFKFFHLNKIYTLRSVWVSLHSCMNLTKQEITFQLGENYYKKDCRHNFKCFFIKRVECLIHTTVSSSSKNKIWRCFSFKNWLFLFVVLLLSHFTAETIRILTRIKHLIFQRGKQTKFSIFLSRAFFKDIVLNWTDMKNRISF